jgi:hypothetical protein
MLAILQDVYGAEPERVLRIGAIEVPSIRDDEVPRPRARRQR